MAWSERVGSQDRTSTDAAGRFETAGLPPGRYVVQAGGFRGDPPIRASLLPAEVEVAEGKGTAVDLRVPVSGATIRLLAAGMLIPGDSQWPRCEGELYGQAARPPTYTEVEGEGEGERVFARLPAGRYTAVAWVDLAGGVRLVRKAIDVGPDEERRIELEPRSGSYLPACAKGAELDGR